MSKLTNNERIDEAVKKYKNELPRLVKALNRILKNAEADEDLFAVGKINLFLSICYFDLGDRSSIFPYAMKAVGVFEKIGNHNFLSRSYNMLGLAYLALCNYQLALSTYNKALATIRRRKRPGLSKDTILNNIAECYYEMGEYRKGNRIYEDCFRVVRTTRPDDHVCAVIYGINISDCYESCGDYQKALNILDTIKPNCDVLDREVLVWGYYGRRCCVLYLLGLTEEAEKYADLVIDAVTTNYDSYEFHRDFEKIAAQEVKSGDFVRAQRFADILKKYADENGNTIDMILSKRVQANICYAKGEMDAALGLYKELNVLYERRIKEENAMQYEIQKNADTATKEVSKLMKRVRDSEQRAQRDALTGLMNRSALTSVAESFFNVAKERGKCLGGIFLDIDYFKEYNDTYGHAAGDEAIKFIARQCMEEETSTVKFFRYGGDEYFGFILGHKEKDLQALALRISEKVRASAIDHVKNPNGQRITVSIGIVNIDLKKSDDSVLDIIKYADRALYHAKDRGKDDVFQYCVLDNSEHEFRRVCSHEKQNG